MSRAADIVRDYGLRPDDLVVHTGGDGSGLLADLRGLGCRVLVLDPDGGTGGRIDTLRTTLTPAAARLIRDRYGPVALLLAAADVPLAVASACLAPGGAVVTAAAEQRRAA
ncbi:hypothetical protein J0H58_29730 [bacterium]|nr:hypothetical protein [bacterium]